MRAIDIGPVHTALQCICKCQTYSAVYARGGEGKGGRKSTTEDLENIGHVGKQTALLSTDASAAM